MNEEQFEKIERFVQGKMNEWERLQFEAELQRHKELAANVEAYRMIEAEMQNYDEEAALKASLQNIGYSFINQDKTSVGQPAAEIAAPAAVHRESRKNNHRVPLAVAAVVIALIGVWYFVEGENTG